MLRKGESSTIVVTKFYFVTTPKDWKNGACEEIESFIQTVCDMDFRQYVASDIHIHQLIMDGMYFVDQKGLEFFKSMESRYDFFRVLMLWEGVMGSGIDTIDLSWGKNTVAPHIKTVRSVAQVLPRPIRWWWSIHIRRLARRGML